MFAPSVAPVICPLLLPTSCHRSKPRLFSTGVLAVLEELGSPLKSFKVAPCSHLNQPCDCSDKDVNSSLPSYPTRVGQPTLQKTWDSNSKSPELPTQPNTRPAQRNNAHAPSQLHRIPSPLRNPHACCNQPSPFTHAQSNAHVRFVCAPSPRRMRRASRAGPDSLGLRTVASSSSSSGSFRDRQGLFRNSRHRLSRPLSFSGS